MASDHGEYLQLVVGDGDPAFADAVSDAIEEVDSRVTAEAVTGGDEVIQRAVGSDSLDGVIIGDELEGAAGLIERVTERTDLPAIFITDGLDDRDTIDRVVAAGADDYFPRTSAVSQYELVVDIVTIDSHVSSVHGSQSSSPRTPVKTSNQAYREVFENVTDGLIVQDPNTGRILDVNKQFCEMHGYEPEELVGESVDVVASSESEYSFESPSELITEAREGETQLFEWRNQRRNGETFPVEVHLAVVQLHGRECVLASVRDVTERRRREREYEQIFHGVNDAIVIQDPETAKPLDANDTFLDRLGYDTVAEIRERGLEGLSVTEEGYTLEWAQEICRRVLETDEPETVEWQQVTSDGERRWIEATVVASEVRGEPRVLSIQRDITERKRREQEYEQIYNNVTDAIAVHDPETGNFVDVNNTYIDQFGYDLDTIQNLGIKGLSVAEEGFTQARGEEILRRVAESDESVTIEWKVRHADGEERIYEVNATAATIGGEQRVLTINHDITERRQREHEYEQIFNEVTDAISVHDPQTGEIVDVNETLCSKLGYDRDTILELGLAGVSVQEEGYTAERGYEIVRRVMESREPETFEWKVETTSGQYRWMEVNATPATINGEERYLAIDRDITERKRREQRLEVFNRILRHNLRNQVDVIKSHAEAVADGTGEDHAQQIIASADRIGAIGNRAREIDDLMSRDLEQSTIDLTCSIRGIFGSMNPTDEGIDIERDLPDIAQLVTDGEVLETVLDSVLDNAVKYAESTVTVTVENISDGYRVIVQDDGPGVSSAALAPLDAGTETDLQHGRGLGLWQLKWGVEKIHGDLSFESDDGTTVRITVPDLSDTAP